MIGIKGPLNLIKLIKFHRKTSLKISLKLSAFLLTKMNQGQSNKEQYDVENNIIDNNEEKKIHE